jgi:hypothetical protein
MRDVTAHAQNAKVLAYIGRGRPVGPVFAWQCEDSAKAYYESGCHPDIVERIWDQIGAALSSDCRSLVYGTPALTHPVSGVILAIGMGTSYGLRLADPGLNAALAAGAKTLTTWTGGALTDIRAECGVDWVFGAWAAAEIDWCRQAFDAFG